MQSDIKYTCIFEEKNPELITAKIEQTNGIEETWLKR